MLLQQARHRGILDNTKTREANFCTNRAAKAVFCKFVALPPASQRTHARNCRVQRFVTVHAKDIHATPPRATDGKCL